MGRGGRGRGTQERAAGRKGSKGGPPAGEVGGGGMGETSGPGRRLSATERAAVGGAGGRWGDGRSGRRAGRRAGGQAGRNRIRVRGSGSGEGAGRAMRDATARPRPAEDQVRRRAENPRGLYNFPIREWSPSTQVTTRGWITYIQTITPICSRTPPATNLKQY